MTQESPNRMAGYLCERIRADTYVRPNIQLGEHVLCNESHGLHPQPDHSETMGLSHRSFSSKLLSHKLCPRLPTPVQRCPGCLRATCHLSSWQQSTLVDIFVVGVLFSVTYTLPILRSASVVVFFVQPPPDAPLTFSKWPSVTCCLSREFASSQPSWLHACR